MDAGTGHLLEASIKLECSLEVTARALVLYHSFIRCTAEVHYDVALMDMVAAGALCLSARLNEQPIDIDSVICVFYSIVNQTHTVMISDDEVYGAIKQTLSHIDLMMVRVLEFDLNHRLAHQFLMPFLLMIFERRKYIADFRYELGRTCIRFITDFYTQPISTEYSPELIAIAGIDLTLYIHGLLNDLNMIPPWYEGFACDVTPHKVKTIKRIMLNLYENFLPKNSSLLLPNQAEQNMSNQLLESIIPPKEDATAQPQQSAPAQPQQCNQTPVQLSTPTPPQQSAPTPPQQSAPPPPQQITLTRQQQVAPIQPQRFMPIPPQQIMPIQPQQIMPIQPQQFPPIQPQQFPPIQPQQFVPIQPQQFAPIQPQQFTSVRPQQFAPVQMHQVVQSLAQLGVSPQIQIKQEPQQFELTQKQQIAPTQVHQVVQSLAKQGVSSQPPLKKVVPIDVIEIEDMDISSSP